MRTLVAALVLVAACAEERTSGGEACPTWQADVAPALAAACAGCHGGDQPAGSYDLTGYLGALGGGSDGQPNAIAGDPTSALVARLDPASADATHAGQAPLHALLARWVGACELAYLDTPIHPAGVLDPRSAGFHGKELAARGWDLGVCASCHGADYAGGTADAPCTTCHAQGPTACDTCHETVPTTGAHRAHVGAGSAGLTCTTCHLVPASWDAEGHVRKDGAGDPAPAEVVMTGLAETTVEPTDRTGPPSYQAGTCRNVYCHGAVLGASGGSAREPSWASDPPGPAGCDSCHGAPPPSHAQDQCATCHPTGATHLDGVTQVGRIADAGCSGCHGSPTSPAPPRDLAGNEFTTAIGVGAHQAHLQATLSAPVACAACHRVPTSIVETGHLDSAGPAEVNAALGWDHGRATCASAWCHGSAQPRWTVRGEAACGSCHGVPPASVPHTPTMTLVDCHQCHAPTIDASGALLPATHINGVVDR